VQIATSQAGPQDLGTLSRANHGATIVPGAFLNEAADYYQFQAADTFFATLTLKASSSLLGLPAGNWLTFTDTTTNQTAQSSILGDLTNQGSQVNSTGEILMWTLLTSGHNYVISVASWSPGAVYTLTVAYVGSAEGSTLPPGPLPVGTTASVQVTLTNNGTISPISAPVTAGAAGNLVPSGGTILPPTPTGFSSAGQIVPVSYTNVSGATSAAPPAGSTNIPASIYVALGAGPVGGFTGVSGGNLTVTADVYDRIYGQAPALALSERFMGLAVLSQIGTASHVDVSEPTGPAAGDRATQPTGLLKTDTTLDLEDDDKAPDDQVQATTEKVFAFCVQTSSVETPVSVPGAESTNARPRTGASGYASPGHADKQILSSAIAVTVLFAVGERWRRQGQPALDIEV
jgi:hypothetical protein